MLTDAAKDLLAFTGFPQAHWRKLWATNPLERVNGEIKRRTTVVGILPNDAASSGSSPPSSKKQPSPSPPEAH